MQWLRDWKDLCVAADKPTNKKYQSKYGDSLNIYGLAERTAPIPIDDAVWFCKVVYNKEKKRMYLDAREYVLRDGAFIPTRNGIILPLAGWFKLFEVIFKLLKKWSGK